MTRLLDLVDACDFRGLFINELDWSNPTHKDIAVTVEDETYTLTQAADYKGLRIWHCPQLPARRIQRKIDEAVAKDSLERLVIFTSDRRQEWRWPLRSQTGGASPRLLVHPHTAEEPNQQLERRLEAIRIGLDDRPSADLAIIEATITEQSPVANMAVEDIELPVACAIAAIARGNDLIVPDSSTIIEPGDEMIAVTHVREEEELRRLLVIE